MKTGSGHPLSFSSTKMVYGYVNVSHESKSDLRRSFLNVFNHYFGILWLTLSLTERERGITNHLGIYGVSADDTGSRIGELLNYIRSQISPVRLKS